MTIVHTYENVELIRPWGDIIEVLVDGKRWYGMRPTALSIEHARARVEEAQRRLANDTAILAALDDYDRVLHADRRVKR